MNGRIAKRLTETLPLWRWTLVSSLFLVVLSSCPAMGPKVTVDRYLVQGDLDRESIRQAIEQSLRYLDRLPAQRIVGEWPRQVTAGEVRESLVTFMEILDRAEGGESFSEAIRSRFDLFESPDDSDAEVLFTGYYQPVVEGSLEKTAEYRFPIYGRPGDLIEARLDSFKDHLPSGLAEELARERVLGRVEDNRFIPYFSRHEIEFQGRLDGKGYELAWGKDPVDLYFLHIQGSGLLRLPDGRLLQLNYAASNGRPYTSIGKFLVEHGKIPRKDVSMQSLRRYLQDHPDERDEVFSANERYVFFRFLDDGPIGNLGVTLTPERSIATDARLFPKGALAFIVTQRPVLDNHGNLVKREPFSRFVLNQDTGKAIRGLDRVDLYFGAGPEAAGLAGHMNSKGKLYFLMKKRLGP